MTKNWKWHCVVQVLFCVMGIMSFAILSAPSAYAKMSIESISGSIQGGLEVVRIEFSEVPQGAPDGFSIQSPARIALDFPNIENATGRSSININQINLKSINILQTAERSRVVLNLKKIVSYHTKVQGNAVVLVLDSARSENASNVGGVSGVFSAYNEDAYSGDIFPIRDIDFRRGADGSGRLIVELGNDQTGVDLQSQGGNLVLAFLDSSLPEGLRRHLDVSDFGTPMQLVTAMQQNDRVLLTVESIGEWSHSAYQRDNQFVLEIRPKKIDLSNFMQGPVYTGEKLSLNFQNIEVRSLLQVIADFTEFNIVTSDTVVGNLTLRLKDVPWDQALQIIMDSKGLGMRRTGSVLWVAPKDEIDERTKKDYEAADAIQKLEPLRTQAFQLNYAKAETLAENLTKKSDGAGGEEGSGRFLSERGNVIAELRTNQIFVTDIPSKLLELQKLLALLDVPVRQVMIEARIVEAMDTFGRTLGVRLGGGDLRRERGGDGGYSVGNHHRVAWGSNYETAGNAGLIGRGETSGNFVNLPGSLSSVESLGSFALSIFDPSANRFLSLELSALEADGQGKIISSPRIVTADQTKAMIRQGVEIPYQTQDEDGKPKTEFKEAALKLEVTPQITPDGNVILDLDVSKDSRGEETERAGPAINTRQVQTQVLVENGGTVVIGGIFEMSETNSRNKVPFFGDIPIVGYLFRNSTRETDKKEMLIFITPRIVTDGNLGY